MTVAEPTIPMDPAPERQSEIRVVVRGGSSLADGGYASDRPVHLRHVSCDELTGAWTQEVDRLRHHRLVVIVRGELTVSTADSEGVLGSKGCALVPRGNGFAETLGQSPYCQRFLIDFDDDDLPHVDALCLDDSARRLLELANWLLLESDSSFEGSSEFRAQTLRLMLCELNRLVIDDASAIEKQVRGYVVRHLDQAISLADLAHHVGTSRFHLCRLYRRQTGESPMHAVRRLRLETARDILRSTGLPLREVAQRVGLRSEQHLSRLLRVEFGVGAKALRSGA